MQKQIQELQSRLSNGQRTLSDDEKARLQRQGEMMMRQMQRKQDDLNEQVQAAQGDIVDEIGRKMMEVLDRYSKDKGFAIVLDSSAQGTPVVYGAPQLDITQDIIHLYDQQYPLKAGGSSARDSDAADPSTERDTAASRSASFTGSGEIGLSLRSSWERPHRFAGGEAILAPFPPYLLFLAGDVYTC